MSGSVGVLAAYRVFGPVVASASASALTLANPVSSVNGVNKSVNTATTFAPTLSLWLEHPATDTFDFYMNTAVIGA